MVKDDMTVLSVEIVDAYWLNVGCAIAAATARVACSVPGLFGSQRLAETSVQVVAGPDDLTVLCDIENDPMGMRRGLLANKVRRAWDESLRVKHLVEQREQALQSASDQPPQDEPASECADKQCLQAPGDESVRAELAAAQRWEHGFRRIVNAVVGPRASFEIDDIVTAVQQAFKRDASDLLLPKVPEPICDALGMVPEASVESIVRAIAQLRNENDAANNALAKWCPECDPGRSSLASTVGLLIHDVLEPHFGRVGCDPKPKQGWYTRAGVTEILDCAWRLGWRTSEGDGDPRHLAGREDALDWLDDIVDQADSEVETSIAELFIEMLTPKGGDL